MYLINKKQTNKQKHLINRLILFICHLPAVHPDCEAIRKVNQKYWNPQRTHHYGIDPDGAGGVPLFEVKCRFKDYMGFTIVSMIVFSSH